MKFFIDHNLSPQLAKGLKGFGEDVVHLSELFPPDSDDPEWLRYIGTNNLFLVTRDERIRWNPAELQAIKRYQVGAFFLGGKKRGRCELIQQLVRNWPRMKEIASRERRPFAIKIPPSGTNFVKISF